MNKLTDIDEGTIRRVDWQSLVPPTLFFRAFSATFKFSFIGLGALLIAIWANWLGVQPNVVETTWHGMNSASASEITCAEPICVGEGYVVSFFIPIRYAFRLYAPPNSFLARRWQFSGSNEFFLPTVLVGCAIFAVFALALSRATTVRLLTTSRSSLIASFVFAIRKFPSLLLPVLAPCLLIAFLIVVGMIGSIGILRFAAPLTALIGFVTFLLVLITALSSPLAVSAIAAENCDGFDATSRGISYLTQRPLFWIFYMIAAILLVLVGSIVVEFLAWLTLLFVDEVFIESTQGWTAFWRLVIIATPDSYCLVALVVYTNAIYALLRRSVDGTPYDSCALNLSGTKSKKLRKILQDGKGAPTFDSENALRGQPKEADERSDVSV